MENPALAQIMRDFKRKFSFTWGKEITKGTEVVIPAALHEFVNMNEALEHFIKNACFSYAESVVPEPAKPCCGNRSEFNECRKMMFDAIKRDEKESKL